MSRYRYSALAVALAALVPVIPSGAPAAAQTPVDVTLSNGSSSRTLYVENMTGQALTSLDFGSGRSLPFRVRVVDNDFARQPFTVSASITNLYVDNAGTLDYTKKIPSSNVSQAPQATPLSVLNVAASVRPLVDTVSTVTDTAICTTLGVATTLVGGVNACTLSTTGLTGNIQKLTTTVNLANLANLPLLPQAAESGAFTNADYGAGTAGFGDTSGKVGAPTATGRRLLAGQPVTTAAVLTPLHTALDTTLATLVARDTVISGLSAQYALITSLTTSQMNTIIASTVGTAQALVGSQVLSQAGTYVSLPKLDVDVPGTAAAGSYKGTLVVTALQ